MCATVIFWDTTHQSHTRYGSRTWDSRPLCKMTNLLFFLMASLLDFFCWFEEMPLLAAENGYDQVSIGLFNQLQNGYQSAWIICTANKNVSLKSLPLQSFLWSIFLWKVRLQVCILFWWKQFWSFKCHANSEFILITPESALHSKVKLFITKLLIANIMTFIKSSIDYSQREKDNYPFC